MRLLSLYHYLHDVLVGHRSPVNPVVPSFPPVLDTTVTHDEEAPFLKDDSLADHARKVNKLVSPVGSHSTKKHTRKQCVGVIRGRHSVHSLKGL